jgi:hypothetical protein
METLMRTTLNIDEDLLVAYKRLAAQTHDSLSHVIQDALREALALRARRGARPPVRLAALPEAGGLVPGVDLSSHASLTEALEQPADERLRQALPDEEVAP